MNKDNRPITKDMLNELLSLCVDNEESKYLKSYRAILEDSFKNRLNIDLQNKDEDHACVVFENLFRNAMVQVKILCSNLSSKVFDNKTVLKELVDAINRGIRIYIISRKDAQSAVIKKIISYGIPNVYFYNNVEKNKEFGNEDFAVVDIAAYRLEENIKKPEAIVNAYDPVTAVELSLKFNRYLKLLAY